jgi:two-component system, NtrC family, response regulator HydG
MGRILIADDHDALRRGLCRALTEAGHDTEEAPNGNAALAKLHDGYFDVVLSDLKMGGSDGLEVLRTTKAMHPTTAVILMTAFGSVNTAVVGCIARVVRRTSMPSLPPILRSLSTTSK